MASSQVEVQGTEMQLKHLGFVRILAINAAVLVSHLYIYAKQNSGPLKSTVGKVEDAVTAVVSPVYERFKGIPSDILVFLDKKVDEANYKLDERAPPAAKNAASKAQSLVKKASKVLQELAEEAKVDGPVAAISHAGEISKHYAVDKLALVWYKANQYPALHGVFEMAVPTAAHWSDKYNKLVKEMSWKGYSFFNYVPLVPVEEMGKAYKKQVEAAVNHRIASLSFGVRFVLRYIEVGLSGDMGGLGVACFVDESPTADACFPMLFMYISSLLVSIYLSPSGTSSIF